MLSGTQADDPELVKLIETEIELANTFLTTFELASHRHHRIQALQNAVDAVQTGKDFLSKVSSGRREEFDSRLRDIDQKIRSNLDSLPGELSRAGPKQHP